ncbi:MAG TPA: hypothetical protein VMR21_09895 [Vicinamibacteria bacterium]|nr:hypothetical protein [Vicinamibacteria bacterium]
MLHRWATVLVALTLSVSPAVAATVTIDHPAVGCAVAEKYPQFQARFSPADNLAKARILFQPQGTTQWYAVAMHSEGPVFHGVLPKPKKDLETFRYYIEAIDTAAGTTRTPDQTARIVGTAMECEGGMMAGSLGTAAVALEVPAGAPAIPAGFASTGVTVTAAGAAAGAAVAAGAAAGGGGLSTAVVIGAVGAAAAGGAVIVANKVGGSDGSGQTYSGQVSGEYTWTNVCPTPVGGTSSCQKRYAISATATAMLTEDSGGSSRLRITGTMAEVGVVGGCDPGGSIGLDRGCDLNGSPSGLTCRSEDSGINSNGSQTFVTEFSGGLSGGAITGNVTFTDISTSGFSTPGGFSGTCTASASARFPLDLR